MRTTRTFRQMVLGPALAGVIACAACVSVVAAGPIGPHLVGPEFASPAAHPQAAKPAGKDAMPLGRPRAQTNPAITATSTSPLSDPGNLTTLGSLVLVLALIGATAWVIKRASRNGTLMSALGAGGRAPAGILEVLGRYPISAGCTLVMLKVDRRILLISQTGKGRAGLFGGRMGGEMTMQTLSEITDPEDVASILIKVQDDESRAANERFQGLLGQAEREQTRIERLAERRGGMIDCVDLRQSPLAPRRTPRVAPHATVAKVTA